MNSIRKIAPFLLLSVFSITQLHAILPHIHHDHHSDFEGLVIEHHHSDEHSEEVSNASYNHNTTSEFLAHFFEAHSHQHVPNEVVVLVDDLKVQSKSKSDFLQTLSRYQIAVPEEERKPIIQRFSDELHSISYLSSYSLRGPPSLV